MTQYTERALIPVNAALERLYLSKIKVSKQDGIMLH